MVSSSEFRSLRREGLLTMAELQLQPPPSPPLPPALASVKEPSPPPASDKQPSPLPALAAPDGLQPSSQPEPPRFDASRMIGIIRRKALIKDLAAAYHAECLVYCQELLELQRKCQEPYFDVKITEDSRKETARPQKRMKKSR